MIPFGAVLLSSHLLIAVAGGVPDINLKKTCDAAASVTGDTTQSDIDGWFADERDAHDQLVKQWAQYAGTDKDRCVRASADYLPNYVELLTCLEMAKDTRSLPDEQAARTNGQSR
jgi:hypothetical protein